MQRLHFSDKAYSNKLHIPSLSLALVLLISLPSPTSSCKEQEKGSLLKFLDGLSQDGGLTTSWKDGTDCCKWEGIVCSLDRTITDILLASKSLEGPISGSLGNLTELRHLNLSHNSLSGGLPMELVSSRSIAILDISFNQLNGELHALPSSNPVQPLQVLNISSNLFTGSFPSTIWKAMENLIALNASNNSFTGAMPTGYCKSSPSFTVLELYFNKLSGSIPPELGDCTMLTMLRAGYNNLSGTLPDELFNAISLEHLAFPNNDLHGALDGARIINLRNLQTLDLGGNNFSGKIPDSIGQLKRLEVFHLDYNNMSGELPSALSNCTNLITVDLKENNFYGELGKVNFSNLPNLQSLDIYFNNFTGTVPESIYSCSNLTALWLSSNKLQGQLSPRIRDLTYLTFLSLSTNSFSNITNALYILKSSRNLATLLIAENFRGEVMPEDDRLDGFDNLQFLSMQGCSLSGKIPVYAGPSLQYRMSTALPKVLCLSNNKFTGEIPQEVGQLKALLSLNLSFNHLTGQIPQSICNLANLQVLDFSNNNLTGTIPAALSNLHFLSRFNVSNNDLEGPIPSGSQFNTFPTSSFDGNNKLCGPMIIQKCGSAEAPPASILSAKKLTTRQPS